MGDALAADFIVVGSGIAGLRAAVELADHGRVLVITKSNPEEGSTGYAQGGIAAAVGDDDSPERHAADTLAAGDGLCDGGAVQVLVREGPAYVRELIEWGAAFDRDEQGRPALAREGAHSVRRVLHTGDATGREIGRVLGSRLSKTSVLVRDHAFATQAIVRDGRVAGVRFLDRDGRLVDAIAPATLLATGGAGQVYRETTNPAVATGDGIALAFLAGARVMDLEFVQFHPTALAVDGAPRYLLSEALRGEGAKLVNHRGDAFMAEADPSGDLAPRDRVARAIVREIERTGHPVYLSLTHLPADWVRARFPLITSLCQRVGLDIATDRLPVGPAAHYMMGGVATDLYGRTSLPGLFAAGEVACTGVHGANRLASNSLLEGLVFGARAGLAMRGAPDDRGAVTDSLAATTTIARELPAPVRSSDAPPIDGSALQDVMWRAAGVFRDRAGLSSALDTIEPAWQTGIAQLEAGRGFDAEGWRLMNLLTVARLIARAALRREESRGAHSREDFPHRDDLHWTRHSYEDLLST